MSTRALIILIVVLLVAGTGLYFVAKQQNLKDQEASVAGAVEDKNSSPLTAPDGTQINNLNNLTNNQQTTMETGQVAEKGDTVAVQYTGKLTNGKVFDSSIPRGQAFEFVLGSGMVIPGWEKGILGMKVGEKKTLTISPEDGYGAQGVTNPSTGEVVIPPNSTLIFDVELVGVKR